MKLCTKCNEEKPFSEFHKNKANKVDGYQWQCKSCIKLYHNKPEVKQKLKESRRKSYEKNIERERKQKREWAKKNREKLREWQRQYCAERRKVDPAYKITGNLRRRLGQAVKRKSKSTKELVGCDISFLMGYLEAQFKNGMSWDNYGEWHIDHIRPCASFDMENEREQLICFHYSNLQPLWAIDNIKKGAK